MKKFDCKSFLVGFLFAITLMSTTLVYANAKSINVVINKVKLVVGGKNINQTTILYDNSTYVPIRAVGEALGKKVYYDDETSTAYIGEEKVPQKLLNTANAKDDFYEFGGKKIPSFKKYSANESANNVTGSYVYLNVADINSAVSKYENDLVGAGFSKAEYSKNEYTGYEKIEYKNGGTVLKIEKIPQNGRVTIEISIG